MLFPDLHEANGMLLCMQLPARETATERVWERHICNPVNSLMYYYFYSGEDEREPCTFAS